MERLYEAVTKPLQPHVIQGSGAVHNWFCHGLYDNRRKSTRNTFQRDQHRQCYAEFYDFAVTAVTPVHNCFQMNELPGDSDF